MIENNTVPVKINDELSAEINGIVRKVIRLNKRGIRIVLTDINNILNGLNKTNHVPWGFGLTQNSTYANMCITVAE